MPSIIDSLIVELGLDPSKFQKGARDLRDDFKKTKDDLTKGAKDIEAATSKTAESVSVLTRGFQGLFALFAGGIGAYAIKNFVEQITSADSAVGRLAANLNMQPGNLQAWGLLVERIGGNAKEAQASVLALSDRLQSLRYLGENLPKEFFMMSARAQRHGGPGLNLFGRGVEGTMEDISADIQAIAKGEGRQAAYFWGRRLGLSPDVVNVMIEQGSRLKQSLREVQNVAADPKDIEAAKQRQEAWAKLEQTITQLGRKITTEFTPAIMRMLSALQTAAEYLQSAIKPVSDALDKIAKYWPSITGLGGDMLRTYGGVPSGLLGPGTGQPTVKGPAAPGARPPPSRGLGAPGSLRQPPVSQQPGSGNAAPDTGGHASVSPDAPAPTGTVSPQAEQGSGLFSGAWSWAKRQFGYGDSTDPNKDQSRLYPPSAGAAGPPAPAASTPGASGGASGAVSGGIPQYVLERAKQLAASGNPRQVQAYLAQHGHMMDGPWCARFVAAVVRDTHGISGGGRRDAGDLGPGASTTLQHNPAWASNWMGYGTRDNAPHVGDIAVKRGNSAHGHVGIVSGVDPRTGSFTMLGGNQGGRWYIRRRTGDYSYRIPPPLGGEQGQQDPPAYFGYQGIPSAWIGSGLGTIHNSPVYNSGANYETHIHGPVNVQTNASDPEGVASFLGSRFMQGAYGNFANDGAH